MALLYCQRLLNPLTQFSSLVARRGRCFSSFENKLSLFDIFVNEEDVDRNGLVLPSVNSIVSYTAQRQYRVGKYVGIKLIDGIQKLQILITTAMKVETKKGEAQEAPLCLASKGDRGNII